MTRLTPAERLAATDRDTRLDDIVTRASSWDRFLVEQAVYALGLDRGTFSANDARDLLPDLARGGVIEKTRQIVPSTSGPTHGHGIYVWRLATRGRAIAAARQPRSGERAA